jgi:hypothetical protein
MREPHDEAGHPGAGKIGSTSTNPSDTPRAAKGKPGPKKKLPRCVIPVATRERLCNNRRLAENGIAVGECVASAARKAPPHESAGAECDVAVANDVAPAARKGPPPLPRRRELDAALRDYFAVEKVIEDGWGTIARPLSKGLASRGYNKAAADDIQKHFLRVGLLDYQGGRAVLVRLGDWCRHHPDQESFEKVPPCPVSTPT